MGRIRTIKPEFPQSESIGRLSRDGRLLFVQLWTVVDDSGRTRAASRMLASLLYPYDDDAGKRMDGWLKELEKEGFIRCYTVDGSSYLEVLNWLKHQKIDHPSTSRLPSYEDSLANPRECSREPASNSRSLAPDLVPVPRTMDHGPVKEGTKDLIASSSKELPAIYVLPILSGQSYGLPEALYRSYEEAYPAVSVTLELGKMNAWLLSNPTKQKTLKGMPAFMNSWLARAQNGGGNNGTTNKSQQRTNGNIEAFHAAGARFEHSEAANDFGRSPTGSGQPAGLRGLLDAVTGL